MPSNEGAEGPYPTVVTQDDGAQVLVVQAYAYGKYLGHLEVTFDDNGVVTEWDGNPILLDGSIEQGMRNDDVQTMSSIYLSIYPSIYLSLLCHPFSFSYHSSLSLSRLCPSPSLHLSIYLEFALSVSLSLNSFYYYRFKSRRFRGFGVHAYAYGKYLGYLEVTFDENGVVTEWDGNPILLDGSIEQGMRNNKVQIMSTIHLPIYLHYVSLSRSLISHSLSSLSLSLSPSLSLSLSLSLDLSHVRSLSLSLSLSHFFTTIVPNQDGSKVLVVQAYAYGKYLGYLEVTFDDNGVVTEWGGNPILLDGSLEQGKQHLTSF